jgi:hypothetical protein
MFIFAENNKIWINYMLIRKATVKNCVIQDCKFSKRVTRKLVYFSDIHYICSIFFLEKSRHEYH